MKTILTDIGSKVESRGARSLEDRKYAKTYHWKIEKAPLTGNRLPRSPKIDTQPIHFIWDFLPGLFKSFVGEVSIYTYLFSPRSFILILTTAYSHSLASERYCVFTVILWTKTMTSICYRGPTRLFLFQFLDYIWFIVMHINQFMRALSHPKSIINDNYLYTGWFIINGSRRYTRLFLQNILFS